MLGGLALCLSAGASYLEENGAAAAPEGPAVRPVPPPPAPDNPMTRAIRRASLRPGYTYKGLTVVPLDSGHVDDRTNYASVAESLGRKWLVITEKGGGNVPVLLGENVGARPILMLAGEILTGGKQNRVLRQDVLLLPEGGPVELPVHCVERGRWSGGDAAFEGNRSLSALKVRVAASAGLGQQTVWENVSGYRASLGVPSATEDLQAVQDADEVREAVAEYREAFRGLWRPETVGMVVAHGGQIVGADIFCNAAVFGKHRDRLLESYAVDCYALRRAEKGATEEEARAPRRREAEAFLRRALRARYDVRPTPGAGRRLALEGPGVTGSGLVYGDALLHGAVFPEPEVARAPPQARSGGLRQPAPPPRVAPPE
jgi:hypothetical protein